MTALIPETLEALSVPIDSIHPYPRNPRRGSTHTIRQSLRAHGQYRPLVVNARTRDVLAGNHTYLAAREEGWRQIAVTFVDVDDEQAAKIVLVDNRSSDLALYEDSELVALLRSLDDTSGTGYDDDDVERL
jgi:ParB-like chromosome segregation protein Spo0J